MTLISSLSLRGHPLLSPMASLPLSTPILRRPGFSLFPRAFRKKPFSRILPLHPRLGLHPRRCTILPPLEISPTEEDDEEKTPCSDLVAAPGSDKEEIRPDKAHFQLPKWPLWIFGPSILLLTGMAPTLFLPLPSVFLGADIAGFLALIGLDCIFNMGATLFLLMADACARPNGPFPSLVCSAPLGYKLWNFAAGAVGFLAPLAMLLASNPGWIHPPLPPISFAVLLGPYLLLLLTQMLTEALTWHWKSPVWVMVPVVYEAYRVLQLMRGLQLAAEVAAPQWSVDVIRGLVSWWVLVLGIQLMRLAWFAVNSPLAESSSSRH